MPRRVVIALLQPVRWHPPGIPPDAWRAALAEDVVDLIATLNETDAGIAVPAGERGLAEAVAWPGMRVYELPPLAPALVEVLRAVAGDGYDQAAVLAPDAPDLPGLLIGKLMRPLTTRTVAVAPAADRPALPPRPSADGGDHGGAGGPAVGLLGLACRLPAPAWLPGIDLDSGSAAALREAAPSPAEVSVTAGWRRLRDRAALATLDPAVEGWEHTRALLSAR